ncbi:MAG: ParB/RepB/Spo0J family partition protein [Pseudomonadota bacterium]
MSMAKDKKRGLGRGLSALMADVAEAEAAPVATEGTSVQMLPIEEIHPNPDQPRKVFGSEELDDLARSIATKGVIQPLIVRQVDDGYQIVAGERRWRAAQQAQLHELPVVVRSFDDIEVLEVAIIENIQREDLNPVDEALAYRQLMERHGHTQAQVSEALGKSRSHLANTVRLLQLPEKALGLLRDGKISSGHARAILSTDDPDGWAERIATKGLSVREVEAGVRKEAAGDPDKLKAKAPKPEKDADTKALEEDLSAGLGMKVHLDHKPGAEAGQMVIAYKTLEELDDLCRKLSS